MIDAVFAVGPRQHRQRYAFGVVLGRGQLERQRSPSTARAATSAIVASAATHVRREFAA